MVAGIAAFLIIHVVEKRKNVNDVGEFGRGQEKNEDRHRVLPISDILIMELR